MSDVMKGVHYPWAIAIITKSGAKGMLHFKNESTADAAYEQLRAWCDLPHAPTIGLIDDMGTGWCAVHGTVECFVQNDIDADAHRQMANQVWAAEAAPPYQKELRRLGVQQQPRVTHPGSFQA